MDKHDMAERNRIVEDAAIERRLTVSEEVDYETLDALNL
jgi:hypothetical protein